MGRLMAMRLKQTRSSTLPDLILPVPIARKKLFLRGYNQSVELARRLSRSLDIELDIQCAKLARNPEEQIGQSAAQRRRNLRGAFRVDRDLSGLHVALLDDVMTTGATLDALARAARKAGARKVEAWALARAP